MIGGLLHSLLPSFGLLPPHVLYVCEVFDLLLIFLAIRFPSVLVGVTRSIATYTYVGLACCEELRWYLLLVVLLLTLLHDLLLGGLYFDQIRFLPRRVNLEGL